MNHGNRSNPTSPERPTSSAASAVASPGGFVVRSQRDEYTGHIQLILGPMFAGKSSELLRRIKRYEVAKKKVLLVKYMHDVRYSKECIGTHDKEMVFALPTDKLSKIAHACNDYDVIGIDEGQFFPDLLSFSEEAANHGKIVIVSALDGTFQRKTFGQVCELMPMAESVMKLHAVCMICQNDAAFSLRTTAETETEVIGGQDKYLAVCRRCYMTNQSPQRQARKKRVEMDQQNGNATASTENGTDFSPKKIRFINNSVASFSPAI